MRRHSMSSALASAIPGRRADRGKFPDSFNPVHPREDPRDLKSPESLCDGRAGAVGRLGYPLVAREADPALGVVEAPEKRLKHRQRFGRDNAIRTALLGPAAQAARPVHDPNLGVAIERAGAAEAKHLLASLRPPNGPGRPRGGLGRAFSGQGSSSGLYGLGNGSRFSVRDLSFGMGAPQQRAVSSRDAVVRALEAAAWN